MNSGISPKSIEGNSSSNGLSSPPSLSPTPSAMQSKGTTKVSYSNLQEASIDELPSLSPDQSANNSRMGTIEDMHMKTEAPA